LYKDLKEYYNLTEILIAKTDTNVNLNLSSSSESNNVKINFYNPVTHKELNMTLCQDDTISVKTPIKECKIYIWNPFCLEL
jgi:hypothetical protein